MTCRIERDFLAAVLERVAAWSGAPSVALRQRLRAAWPERLISVCSAEDIPAWLSPLAENECAAIYAVAVEGHCLMLTDDTAQAAGIVVTLRASERIHDSDDA
ncbi:MAG: hypothetical protein N2441_01295 [Rhodocyclaceae bacterium]|nr:hypothetical protein [Rhodocyclaceae bacterium]